MKKFILFSLAFISVLFLGIKIFEYQKYLEITQYKYNKTESVFEGNFKCFDETQYRAVEVFKFNNKFWIINGKKYTQQKTAFSIYDPTVNWKIDISILLPCGICGDIRLYSSTGDCDNELLVAKENDELYLITSSNILSPFQYSISDFSCISSVSETKSDNLSNIWKAHLKGENDIRYLVVDNNCKNNVELKLKKSPELIYPLSYCVYKGDYFSKLPFDETSNNYYSMFERLKQRDKTGDGSVSYSKKR